MVEGGQLDLHKVGLVRGSDTESGWFRRRSGEVGINLGEHIAWQGLRVRRGCDRSLSSLVIGRRILAG